MKLPSKLNLKETSMHFSTRQCKTTFCTHYKGLTKEEQGTGTGRACSTDLSPIENMARIIKQKIKKCDNEHPPAHEHL